MKMHYEFCEVECKKDYVQVILKESSLAVGKEKMLFLHDDHYVTCFRHIQNDRCFYYDVMHLTSLSDYLQTHALSTSHLTEMMVSILNIMQKKPRVLSSLDHIFIDQSKQLQFCQIPGMQGNHPYIAMTLSKIFEVVDFKGDEAWLSRLYFLVKRQPFDPELILQFLTHKEVKKHWFHFFKKQRTADDFDFFDTYSLHEAHSPYDSRTSSLEDEMATQLLFTGVDKRYLEDTEGKQTLLQISPFTVGRSEGCNLILHSPEISKLHCRFEVVDGVCMIEDLKSTNGTYLNHERLTAHQTYPLHEGDMIQIGSRSFTYHQ